MTKLKGGPIIRHFSPKCALSKTYVIIGFVHSVWMEGDHGNVAIIKVVDRYFRSNCKIKLLMRSVTNVLDHLYRDQSQRPPAHGDLLNESIQ